MDAHIEELFEKAPSFLNSELILHPEYTIHSITVNTLEDMLMEIFGREVAQLIREYLAARFEVERFQGLHYFQQGYLAAKREAQEAKEA